MAVVYHKCAYGNEPPRACWRLLQILGNPANKKLVAHELNYAATFTESWWDDLATCIDGKNIAIPFPITVTCLALATGFDHRPGTSYYHVVEVLSTGRNFTTVYNDDGFTIVDITNLDDIRFCFLFPFEKQWGEGNSQTIEPPPFTPLTAEEYIAEYAYTPDDAKVDVDLSCWGLIDADTLRDLWPNGHWRDRIRGNDDGPVGGHMEQQARIASLKELAFFKVIGKHLDHPELGMVEQLLPDFFVCLRKWLQKFPESVKTPHGLRILGRSMKGARCLDLSAFHWLSEEAIIQLVKENADVDIVDSVDLSTNTTITASGIEKLLQVCPNVTKLFTLHTPKLSMDALVGALAESNVDELLHAELFRSPFRGVLSWEMRPIYATRSAAVTQIVYLSAPNSAKEDDSCRLDQKGLRWSKLKLLSPDDGFYHGVLGPECGTFATCIPVRDAFLVLSRVMDWFDQLLNFFGSHSVCHEYEYFTDCDIPKACARAMALELRNAWKVRPIPVEPLDLDHQYWPEIFPRFEELKIGEWTLLIATEEKRNSRECETLRYAFVTRDEAGQLLTADINDFVGRPAQLTAPYQAKRKKTAHSTTIDVPGEEVLATIDWSRVTVCGTQEVADVMGPFMTKYNKAWHNFLIERF